jgi:hypothetical protein
VSTLSIAFLLVANALQAVGASLGVLTSNIFLDKIYIALANRRGDSGRPEDRLPFMIAGGALFPFVVVLSG